MKYDVIVVGSGPAGSSAARRCALKGLETLIIEKEKLPRYKPCGGGITTKTQSMLDFPLTDDLIECECFGLKINYKGYEVEERIDKRVAILTMRDRFDAYLTKKAVEAGAELKENEEVKAVDVKGSGVEVGTDKGKYKAEVIVGADGVTSRVARHVRPAYRPNELFLAVETEIPEKNIEQSGVMNIYFGGAPDLPPLGYGWVFPKREHLSVGIGGRLTDFKNPVSSLGRFLKSVGLARKGKVFAHLLPMGGYKRKLCSDRILLVGDAAGFVDPINGEGIYYAVASGIKAAEVIDGAHKDDNFSEDRLMEYQNICRREFDRELGDSLKITMLMHKYPNVFIKTLASNRDLVKKSLQIPAGIISHKEFRRWFLLRIPYFCIRSIFV